jgi:hypothetical protein
MEWKFLSAIKVNITLSRNCRAHCESVIVLVIQVILGVDTYNASRVLAVSRVRGHSTLHSSATSRLEKMIKKRELWSSFL